MFARISNGVFHYKHSFINTHNKNSSVFQQMEEFFIAYTQTISPFGYGRTFLIAIPNPFSPFGYGRVFPIAYTQTFFSFWVWADISYCLCPIHFHLLGMGGYFLLLIPNPFSPFGYGRTFPIAYTQSIFTFWVWADISYCLYPIHFHLLGMGGHFLLLMPNPFSPFGYGRTFLIAYTQTIP